MKRITISLLMILVGFLCYGQRVTRESMEKADKAMKWYEKGVDIIDIDMDSAYRCMDKALAIFREIEWCDSEAMCLADMAFIKKYKGETNEALAMYDEAEGVAVRCGDTARVLKVLDAKQRLLYEMGRMQERSIVMGKIAEIGDNGKSTQEMIESYERQGKMAQENGDYKMAESMYKKCLGMISMLPERLQMVMKGELLIAMRDLRQDQDRYAEALEYERELLEIHKKMNYERESLAFDYQMLSFICSQMKEKKMTMLYKDSAFACVGDNKKLLIEVADLMIPTLCHIDKYEEALTLSEETDRAIVMEYGRHSKKRINILKFIGNIYNVMGESKKCAEKYSECEKLTLEVCGVESDEHITALRGLANSLALAGEIEKGAEEYVRLQNMLSKIAKESMGSMSQTDRENYWNKTADTMQKMTSYGLAGNVKSKDFIDAACNALIFSKSLLLESEVSQQELVERKGTEEDKKRYASIKSAKSRIEELSNDYDKNENEIVALKQQVANDEWLLCSRFKEYSEYTEFLNIKVDDVRKEMPENSVLIDYADIKTEKGHFHAAYITDKKGTDLQMVFDWKRVEKMLDGAPIDVLYKGYMNEEARGLIWDSLSGYVDEGCTIYYVPSGMMHQISLEAFTAQDGKLLGEHYHFVRLSSARELVKKSVTVKPQKAVLYGGLKYEMSADSMLAESRKYTIDNLIAETRGDERGDSIFKELPHTRDEVNEIAGLLRKSGVNVTPLVGAEGCEESFIAMSGKSPEVLHIATHGFYYTPKAAMRVSYVKGYDNAMMRSGLALSGANAARRAETVNGVCDGLLRAGDIAKMNLSRVDLVVLSACQTGLGKVTAEGVFGLQRGFKLAGVKTIVMTLWSVNDEATKEFMVKFYERLVADGWNKRKAFDETRIYMRGKYPSSPYYWAGFVMVD